MTPKNTVSALHGYCWSAVQMSTPWTKTNTPHSVLPPTLGGSRSHGCCSAMAPKPPGPPLGPLEEPRERRTTWEADPKRSTSSTKTCTPRHGGTQTPPTSKLDGKLCHSLHGEWGGLTVRRKGRKP